MRRTPLLPRPVTPRTVGVLLLAAIAIGGCGSQSLRAPYSGPRALMTESDRYAECVYEAYREYQTEVDAAEQFTYPSAASARQTAVSVRPGRFDELLAQVLRRHGFTVQGLQVHASQHPEFVEAQRGLYQDRLTTLRERVVTLSGQAPPPNSWAFHVLDLETRPRVASR
ncbi:MAG: hypothetical protein ACFCGT_16135 [Sandaracinaceae bacterium]